jgi:mRNA-degrading endonuclease RelE of RelBE toxin-antitoxin system
MSYRVHVSPQAAAAFNRLPDGARVAVYPHLTALADNPFPPNSKPLRGNLKGWRSLRVGDYRVRYLVDETENLIRVRMVADRRDFHSVLSRLGEG